MSIHLFCSRCSRSQYQGKLALSLPMKRRGWYWRRGKKSSTSSVRLERLLVSSCLSAKSARNLFVRNLVWMRMKLTPKSQYSLSIGIVSLRTEVRSKCWTAAVVDISETTRFRETSAVRTVRVNNPRLSKASSLIWNHLHLLTQSRGSIPLLRHRTSVNH